MPDRYDDKEDKELLELFYADRNNEWLGILLQRYTRMLLGVSLKYLKNEEDAKDSVQQIFVKVISELHKYKVEYFKSWLYMVAKNHCLMRMRDKMGHTAEINESHMPAVEEKEEMTIAEKEKQYDQLDLALLELNNEQQQCIRLFYLEKRSYRDIAATTGFTEMQVKSHIQNGKRNLKICLEAKIKLD